MLFKTLLSTAFMLFSASVFAQTENNVDFSKRSEDIEGLFKEPVEEELENWGFFNHHNAVKIDFNIGEFLSHFNAVQGEGARYIHGCGASISYENVGKKGYGFGINAIYEGGEDGIRTGFFGPSVVKAFSSDKYTWEASAGVGMGGIDVDSQRFGKYNVGGFGYFAQVEVEAKISNYFGLAAGLRLLGIRTSSKAWSSDSSLNSIGNSGTTAIRFTIGPRIYF